MPPKNKDKSKNPPTAGAPTLLDGLTKEELSKEQLKEQIVRLQEELDREREKKNYFRLETDKIHACCKITLRQQEEVKAQLKSLDKDVEEDTRRHQVEIKVYKQEMNDLLCKHQSIISEQKAGGLVSTEAVHEEQEQLENEPHMEMRAELDCENLVKELELKHEEEMTKTRNSLEKSLAECQAKYEKKMELLLQELENKRLKEIGETEEFWNNHITALTEDHKKALSEIEAFHHMILDQDREKGDSVKHMKMEVRKKKEELAHVLQDKKSLTERISKVNEDIAQTERKLKMNSIPMQKYPVAKKRKELKDLKSKHEALEQKFSELQLERDELYKTFNQKIQKVQDAGNARIMLLERKVKAVANRAETTEAQLCSVLSASDVDQTALAEVANKIEKKLDSKNNTIKNLQFKKALIAKARKDMLLYYEAKLRPLGVPAEELCVKPIESSLGKV